MVPPRKFFPGGSLKRRLGDKRRPFKGGPTPLTQLPMVVGVTAEGEPSGLADGNHRVSYPEVPGGILAGDVLFLTLHNEGGSNNTLPGGWTNLIDTSGIEIWYARAVGGESGAFTFTASAATHPFGKVLWVIRGVDPALAPEAVAIDGSFDPPAISPSWGALGLSLVIVGGTRRSAAPGPVVTGRPEGYNDITLAVKSGHSGNDICFIAQGAGWATASTIDPGTFSFTAGVVEKGFTAVFAPTLPVPPPRANVERVVLTLWGQPDAFDYQRKPRTVEGAAPAVVNDPPSAQPFGWVVLQSWIIPDQFDYQRKRYVTESGPVAASDTPSRRFGWAEVNSWFTLDGYDYQAKRRVPQSAPPAVVNDPPTTQPFGWSAILSWHVPDTFDYQRKLRVTESGAAPPVVDYPSRPFNWPSVHAWLAPDTFNYQQRRFIVPAAAPERVPGARFGWAAIQSWQGSENAYQPRRLVVPPAVSPQPRPVSNARAIQAWFEVDPYSYQRRVSIVLVPVVVPDPPPSGTTFGTLGPGWWGRVKPKQWRPPDEWKLPKAADLPDGPPFELVVVTKEVRKRPDPAGWKKHLRRIRAEQEARKRADLIIDRVIEREIVNVIVEQVIDDEIVRIILHEGKSHAVRKI